MERDTAAAIHQVVLLAVLSLSTWACHCRSVYWPLAIKFPLLTLFGRRDKDVSSANTVSAAGRVVPLRW